MTNVEPTRQVTEPRLHARSDAALHEEVAAVNARFVAALSSGDFEGAAALYTSDALVMPANSDFVRGRDAIASFWRGAMASGIADARLETVEIEARGDLAVEVGRYTLTGADGGTVDFGKYIVTWHREPDGWRIHRDIWTTSRA